MKKIYFALLVLINALSVSAQKENDSIESKRLFDLASDAYYTSKDYHSAINYANEAIAKDSTNEEAFALISLSYLFLDEYTYAIKYADLALKFDANNYYSFSVKALAEFKLQNYKATIEYATKAISLGLDDNILVYQHRGLSYVKLGELRLGYQDLRQAIKVGGDGEVYFQYGVVAFDLEEFQESLKYIHAYIKYETINIHAYLYRAKLYMEYGYFEEALADINTFTGPLKKGQFRDEALYIKSQPDVTRALGICYANLGDLDKGIKYLKEFLEIEPSMLIDPISSYVVVHTYLAGIYFDLGDLESVKNHLKEMTELVPEEGYPYLQLAKLYHNEEEYETSLNYLIQLKGKSTGFVEMTAYLKEIAELFIQYNEIDKALYYHLEYLKINPDDKEIKQELEGVFFKNSPKYLNEHMMYYDIIASEYDSESEEFAYFQVKKSMLFVELNELDNAIEGISKGINIHPFSEYYALRSLIYLKKYTELVEQEGQEEPLLKLKKQIFKDIEKAAESNHRKADAYMLKTTYLMYFEMRDEACKTANEAIKLGAKINKNQVKSICTGKEPKEKNSELEFTYNLSSVEVLFSE